MMPVESVVKKTIKDWNLIADNDKVVCAVSGGKDSTTALYLVNKWFDDVEAITIDASIGNYSKVNLANIKDFCRANLIKLRVVSFREEFGYSLCYLQSVLKSKGFNLNSCAICGVLKRYLLNKKARELRKTVLVTGHNMDDEAQSVLMNLLRGNIELLARLGPKTGVIKVDKFVQRVKPLYFVPEKQVEAYSKSMNFPVKYGRCPCSVDSYRNAIRGILSSYELRNPLARAAIISYFIKLLPNFKQRYGNIRQISRCSSCGEPAKNKICKACELVKLIKMDSLNI